MTHHCFSAKGVIAIYREKFAVRLFECRTKAGLSQKALGELVGLTDASVNMMERGKRAPSFDVLLQLSDYFHVSLDYLCGRSDNPSIN